MELKPGYKLTEVGVIPAEWEVKPLGEVTEFLDGRRRPVKDSDRAKMRGEIPYYGASGIVDYVNAYLFDEELILLGEDGENILSRNCRLAFKIAGKTWVNNHAHVLKPKTFMALDYLVEVLESGDYAQYNTGTAQPKLNKAVCLRIPVTCPPLPEQRAIAEVLSDVDALLGALDRLIAKKRDLKQAAMQQLLTGQTRLPGFSGDWEVKRLGAHVRFLRNGVNSRAELQPEGPVKYLHYGDIHANTGTFVTPSMLPSLPVEKAVSLDRLQDGDLVFADASEDLDGVSKSVEVRDVGAAEVVAGQHTIAARFDRSVLADRFKSLLQFCPAFAVHLRRLAAGTKVYATNRAHIASAEVLLPKTDEQTAIANVFSDIDAELEALEQRRAKTAALKQGMMQELLTGRTRLV